MIADALYFAMSFQKKMKMMNMRWIEMIIRFLIIVLLAGYSGIITVKYIETKKERDFWKAKYEGIMNVPDFEEPKGKIYETKIDTHYIIKWRTKEKILKDTIFVFHVEPSILTDTLKVGYNWIWKDFLSVRDTYFVYQDTSTLRFNLSIHRYWQIVNPLKIDIFFYDRKPYEFWWRGMINPPDFDGLVIQGFEDVRKWNIFLGGGGIYNGGFNPFVSVGVSYKRYVFDFLAGIDYIGINCKYRIY